MSNNLHALVDENYDIALFASSWDERSTAITAATRLRCELAIGIFFAARDHQGLRDRHDQQLTTFGKNIANTFDAIYGPSNHVRDIWIQLEDKVRTFSVFKNRPLSVLIDLSACPRFFSLGLLALCFRQRIASTVTVVYAEGEYTAEQGTLEFAFTGGRWKTVAIPYLEGICDPGNDRFYFVSVGFEGTKTFRSVSQADPDRISILLPDPGSSRGYAERTESNNSLLLETYRVPQEQIVRAPAGDAVAALRALAIAKVDCRPNEHTSYLCCGTKSHALAFSIRALALDTPTVLYNIPEEHKVHITRANGRYWKYLFRDVTSLV